MQRALHPHQPPAKRPRLAEQFAKAHLLRSRPTEPIQADVAERRPGLKPGIVVGVSKDSGIPHLGERIERGTQGRHRRVFQRVWVAFDDDLISLRPAAGHRLESRVNLGLSTAGARKPGPLHPAQHHDQRDARRHEHPEQTPALPGGEEVAGRPGGVHGSEGPEPSDSDAGTTGVAAAFCRRISRHT